jgi:hypothetical protein
VEMGESDFFAASGAAAEAGGVAAGALFAGPELGGTGNGPCCWALSEPQQNMASARHPVMAIGLMEPLRHRRSNSATIRFRSR